MQRIFLIVFMTLLFAGCGLEQQPDSAADQNKAVSEETAEQTSILREKEPADFEREASSIGQLVYVPVYSHIYQQNRRKTFNLTTTLSIRNADPFRPLTINQVAYYDSEGKLIQQYVDSTEYLQPLASTSYVIGEADLRGGVGANFLVRWQSQKPVFPPVIEAVNISTSQQQGISFLSVGRVLQERSVNESITQ